MQTVPNFLIKGLGKERKGGKINVFEFFCTLPASTSGRGAPRPLPSSFLLPVFGRKIQLGFTAAPLKFMGKPAPWRGEDGERGTGRTDDGVSAIDPPPSSSFHAKPMPIPSPSSHLSMAVVARGGGKSESLLVPSPLLPPSLGLP